MSGEMKASFGNCGIFDRRYHQRMPAKWKRVLDLLLLLGIYLIAFGLAGMFGTLFHQHGVPPLVNALLVDLIATVIVFIAGLIAKSPSVYDPYWSLQTFFIMLLMLIEYGNWNWGTGILLAVVLFYSVRLTWNFCLGFHDISYIDWRYAQLRAKTGGAFQLVNFFGIHMMPTLVVYLASVPMFLYCLAWNFYWVDLFGLAVMLGAVALELIADVQVKRWITTRTDHSEVNRKGLWNYSRHPNYLGEILFWFGGALLLFRDLENTWYWFSGALAVLLLFLFISIPMIEKRFLTYKPGYLEYKKTTSCLLILPHKDTNN